MKEGFCCDFMEVQFRTSVARFFFDESSPCPLPHVTPHLLDAGVTLPRPVPQKGTAVYLPWPEKHSGDVGVGGLGHIVN